MPDNGFDFDQNDFDFGEVQGSHEEVTHENTADGEGATRPSMNLVFLLDTSGSMYGRRITQLNTAMPIALDAARSAALDQEVDLYVRVISFNTNAVWYMGSKEKGVPVNDAYNNWKNLDVTGGTNTAAAIRLARSAMSTTYLGTRNYHPVVILITDGGSDSNAETKAAIEELRGALSGGNPNKKDKVWRFAIGVEGYHEPELLDFAMVGTKEDEFGNEQNNVPMMFKVDNVDELAKVLKTVTVSSLLASVGAGAGTDGGAEGEAAPIIPI